MKSVLKSCGQYIKRLSFPDHVACVVKTPCKLTPILLHCSNVVQLNIATSKLTSGELEKLIKPMGRLESLDISWIN